ncbi:MAG: GDP-mannose 4,6-dehydratase, partial [Alphaproteobacteria bacterium]|nr:GDP-mannose 4,6-dehydratase [Alphaproteobacteria bacterium]
DRPGHDHRYAIDPAKIEREIGWRPQVALEEGIARTVAWYIENRWWWEAVRQRNRDGTYAGGKQVA